MFDQTFLSKPKSARKPYSMVLSLILQISIIGILCLVPFVFTEVLPTMQLKSVLAAPPKPPVALRARASAAQVTNTPVKTFRLPTVMRPLTLMPRDSKPDVEVPEVGSASDAPVGDVVGIPDGVIGVTPVSAPVAPKPVPAKPAAPKVLRVGTISSANIVHMVQPAYPPMARSVRVEGTVEFTATISKEGMIENLSLVRGHPLLVNAAKEAVLQWRYKPTMLNGEPVEVITDISVVFTLNR